MKLTYREIARKWISAEKVSKKARASYHNMVGIAIAGWVAAFLLLLRLIEIQ